MSSRFINPGSLPRPPGYGYMPQGTQPIRQTEVDLPRFEQPETPEQVGYHLSQQQEQYRIPMPDIVKVKYAGGDPQMVSRVFNIAQGKDAESQGLFGLTKEDALRQLQEWGYPTDSTSWTTEQWTEAITAASQKPNLLSALGY